MGVLRRFTANHAGSSHAARDATPRIPQNCLPTFDAWVRVAIEAASRERVQAGLWQPVADGL